MISKCLKTQVRLYTENSIESINKGKTKENVGCRRTRLSLITCIGLMKTFPLKLRDSGLDMSTHNKSLAELSRPHDRTNPQLIG